ncbi:MAG: class I SAM-dependent methyltransferase [Thermoguttaceae bacterium]
MSEDFNQHVQSYREQMRRSQSFAGADHDFYLRAKAVTLVQMARRHFGDPAERSVLDVGCGIGLMESHLVGKFRELIGIDVAAQAVEYARRARPGVEFCAYDGRTLPFPDDRFDIAFAACVLHHVPRTQWPEFLGEMTRVVKPRGLVFIFEHNPYNPLTQMAVARCELDRDAVLLRPGCSMNLLRTAGLRNLQRQFILFFPWAGKFWSAMESRLHWLPLGAQYCAVGTKGLAATLADGREAAEARHGTIGLQSLPSSVILDQETAGDGASRISKAA